MGPLALLVAAVQRDPPGGVDDLEEEAVELGALLGLESCVGEVVDGERDVPDLGERSSTVVGDLNEVATSSSPIAGATDQPAVLEPVHEGGDALRTDEDGAGTAETWITGACCARDDLATMLLDQLDDQRFVRRIAAVTTPGLRVKTIQRELFER